jgi:hypothetical protein
MMSSLKVFPPILLTATLVACGGKTGEAPARSGRAAVSRATDDTPTSNRTDLYVDRFRFGCSKDADSDGIIVRETSLIPPGLTAAMSFYVRNVPAGTQVRVVWNDLGANATLGEEVKPVGGKGLVTFKQESPSPEGSYRVNMFVKQPQSQGWGNLGSHDFKVGNKS